jgi:hypothetical protein
MMEVVEYAEFVLEKPLREFRTLEECEEATGLVGRSTAPVLVLLFYWENLGVFERLPRADQGKLLCDIWKMAEWPERCLGQREWIRIFWRVGFATDYGATRPTESVQIYRGCAPRFVRRMAWTSDIQKARWFATRLWRTDAFVYTAMIAPEGVLAMIDGKGEREIVVNPRCLKNPVIC